MATNYKEEIIKSKKSGTKKVNFVNNKLRKPRYINIGRGASAIFYRQLLEYRKSVTPFVDKRTFIMLGIGIAAPYLFPGSSINTVLYISIYFLFFATLQGKWGQELSKPYIYLIPSIYKALEKCWKIHFLII